MRRLSPWQACPSSVRQRPDSVHRLGRRGFTLIELLIVIGVALFLLTISIVALGNALTISRERATQSTITKIHGLVQQRIEAFYRALDRNDLSGAEALVRSFVRAEFPTNMRFNVDRASNQTWEILARKHFLRLKFPQTFEEAGIPSGSIPPSHTAVTESSEMLFRALTTLESYGVAPVDSSEFTTAEVKDTDGDGFPEFVDAWGRPLRFYRWPTRLLRPTGNLLPFPQPVDRTVVGFLFGGLSPSVGTEDPLTVDPDDPLDRLSAELVRNAGAAGFSELEEHFHTLQTFHGFLVVSAGPDGQLGLFEPGDKANFGHLAQPISPTATAAVQLGDSITNRRRE